jgi:hypothetical protein
MFGFARRGGSRFPLSFPLSTYPFGARDCEEMKTNKKNPPLEDALGLGTQSTRHPFGLYERDCTSWSHWGRSRTISSPTDLEVGNELRRMTQRRTVDLVWINGHAGTPGNERADELAGKAAELVGTYTAMSLAHLKLRISQRFRNAKDEWHADPAHHGTMEIPPPNPKKSILDRARNSIARVASQIRTGHWRSAVYLKRIRKRSDDKCWFCKDLDRAVHKMTRSHVLLNCRNHQLAAARAEA